MTLRKSPWTLSTAMSQTCRIEILNPHTCENFSLRSRSDPIVENLKINSKSIEK